MVAHWLPPLRQPVGTGSVLPMNLTHDAPAPEADVPQISLVIPVLNGGAFIADSIGRARAFLEERYRAFEIVVADDGSTDDTVAAAEAMTDHRVRLLKLSLNRGKFGALKEGMAAARGRCRVFTDADLPYDLEAVADMVHLVNSRGFHVVVGDRTLPQSESSAAKPALRRLTTRVVSFFVRLLVTGGLFDTQCGLKGFRGDVADALFPLLTDNGFSGDVELLYIALKYNLEIRRIPVQLRRSAPSTVRITAHSLPMLTHILRLRRNWTSGRYESARLSSLCAEIRRPTGAVGSSEK